jgi:hypothetical protein
MSTLVVDPQKIRQFGEPDGATFCLVTSAELAREVAIVQSSAYPDHDVVVFDDDFETILSDRVPGRAHVLVMSPATFFQSPDDRLIGPDRKLLAMACNSTPTDHAALRHFLTCIEATDPVAQEKFSNRFFELAEHGDALEYHDAEFGTTAVLQLFTQDLVWNQQAGLVDWGEQQIVPSGEISVLPIEITDFDAALSLPLDGEIVIRGYPILHSGTPSFALSDQKRIHDRLWPLRENAVRATVSNGLITSLEALSEGASGVVDMLETMFAVDSRYRIVWEIGHALNTTHEILSGNHAMNEVYGGTEGCLHWGIGLTPFTQFHLDIISPGTYVTNDQGETLLGVAGKSASERLAMST